MASSDGLNRMKALLKALGNPEQDFRVIHIAGTNGKGSTAIMIASVLEEAGYTVGLYTSPHLDTYCERIQIYDGCHRMIAQDEFDELTERVRQAGAELAKTTDPETGEPYGELHVFEELTAAAYLYFAEQNPDYVVLECGLGGRLDSTNTIEKPLVSVITQVGLDHTAQLGNTIYKVAREKAGIIKPGVPVVSQSMDLNVKNIMKKTAAERGCEFHDASFIKDDFAGYELSLAGNHQVANAATAALAIEAAGIEVSDEALEIGLANAVNPGRFEVIGENPVWILDGAHNPDATESLVETYTAFTKSRKIKRTLVIFGCMNDKNYVRMIQLLTGSLRGCTYSAVSVEDARSAGAEKLGEVFARCGRNVTCWDSVQEAYETAKRGEYEAVLVTGSIYLVGAMRKYLIEERKQENV